MTKYAKLKEDGNLEYAPRDIPGISNWIEDREAVLAAGYLPLEETPYPLDGEAYYAAYEEKEGRIVQLWCQVPAAVLTYADKRRLAYPPIEEQLDMQYWDKVNGTNNWQQTIAEIKAAYPKPVETDNNTEADNA